MFIAGVLIRDNGLTPKLEFEVPPMLKQVLQKCWSMNPNDRPDFEWICQQFDTITDYGSITELLG